MLPRQRKFVAEIAKGKNQTQAAIAAGYSKRSAAVTASKLLNNSKIQAALDNLNAKSDAAVELSASVLKRALWETHQAAKEAEAYGPAVNALGKLLDKAAPDLVAAVTFVAEVPAKQMDEAAWALLPKP